MFMGISLAGLHWIYTTIDPAAWVLALFPRDAHIFISGGLTSLQLSATALIAYLFVQSVVRDHFSAVVGGLLYALSVFSLQHALQADSSHLVIALLPLGLWIIRTVQPVNGAYAFIGLCAVMTSMLLMSFLQDVAYAFLLFGIYGAYLRLFGRHRSFLPLGLTVGAALVSTAIALPRLITVYEDVASVLRSGSVHLTFSAEFARFFHDGVFGRFFGEAAAYSNGLNLHEGVQLLNSSVAAALVAYAILRLAVQRQPIIGIAFAGLAALFVAAPLARLMRHLPIDVSTLETSNPHIVLPVVATGLLVSWSFFIVFRRALKKISRNKPFDLNDGVNSFNNNYSDYIFFSFTIVLSLYIIIIPELRIAIYFLFLTMDFTHSRLSMIAILPMAVLAAMVIASMRRAESLDVKKSILGNVGGPCVAAAFGLILWFSRDLLSDIFVSEGLTVEIFPYKGVAREIMRGGLSVVLVISILVAAYVLRKRIAVVRFLGTVLGFLVLAELVSYADFKVTGAHTRTFPIAFEGNNFFTAPKEVLVPPDRDQRRALQADLGGAQFRSILLVDRQRYPSYIAPHIAAFWGLRLIDGYSTGVPNRLGLFDWPAEVQGQRTLSFEIEKAFPAGILSLFNVKNFLLVDDMLYYNSVDSNHYGGSLNPSRNAGHNPQGDWSPKRFSNPYNSVPRAFFAAKAIEAPSMPWRLGYLSGSAVAATTVKQAGSKTAYDLLIRDPAVSISHFDRIEVERQAVGFSPATSYFHTFRKGASSPVTHININRVGRYVRIQLGESGVLALAEVEVMGCEKTTKICGQKRAFLEANGTARQSSVNASGTTAEKAIDRKVAADSISMTSPEMQPWWEIDLGQEYHIEHIVIRAVSGEKSNPLSDYNIFVSKNKEEFLEVPSVSQMTAPTGGFYTIARLNKDFVWYRDTPPLPSMEWRYRIRLCEKDNPCLVYLPIVRPAEAPDPSAERFDARRFMTVPDWAFLPRGVLETSFVEDMATIRHAAGGRTDFPVDGQISAYFDNDRIEVRVTPHGQPRLLVLNELYHQRWRAYAGLEKLDVFPVNVAMRGVIVPPGASVVQFEYVPFSSTDWAVILVIIGMTALIACVVFLARYHRIR